MVIKSCGCSGTCTCGTPGHPRELAIDAGLTALPRQVATFPEFRRAMLAELRSHPPLVDWRTRSEHDLGMMLIEMWAYICDSIAFYDETIAHESYLRTARQSRSVRLLVSTVGYRPRPAVAARADLAVRAEGRSSIEIPAGLAIRSSGFGDEPPQVFEVLSDEVVHPLLNGWELSPVRSTTIAGGAAGLGFTVATGRVREGDLLILQAPISAPTAVASWDVRRVNRIGRFTAFRDERFLVAEFDSPITLALSTIDSRALRATGSTTLWSAGTDQSASVVVGENVVTLSSLVPQIAVGSLIAATTATSARAFRVTAIGQVMRVVVAASSYPGGGGTVQIPAISVPVTQLKIDSAWPSALGTTFASIAIAYGFESAGELAIPQQKRVTGANALSVEPPVEAPRDGTRPHRFIFSDVDGYADAANGTVNFSSRSLTLDTGEELDELAPPVRIRANIVTASRGETVSAETLGTGDASMRSQSFTLAKKPLTYLPAVTPADPGGVANTLAVWVRDRQWREVPTFFGVGPEAEVYIVRQDDDGNSSVTFGDGVRGSRLPTGASVIARYRYGAGATAPPAGSLSQLVNPVTGIGSVTNPLPAAGGEDAQPATAVRSLAPRTALLFGRTVSLADMRALAAGFPGVEAVSADWTWNSTLQRPAVQLWYIGAPGIEAGLAASIRLASAPSTPIVVEQAVARSLPVTIDVTIDPRYRRPAIEKTVSVSLTDPDSGVLSSRVMGIGAPLFRSRILEAVLAIEGTIAVTRLTAMNDPFTRYEMHPGAGTWYNTSLTVNATPAPGGTSHE